MDVFTRGIRGWHLGRSLDQSLTLIALQRALAHHAPEIHHSDQGRQYAASAYIWMLRNADVQISMVETVEAWQNGYVERLIRTIKEEEVDLANYLGYTDAVHQLVGSWTRRICTSGSTLRRVTSLQPSLRTCDGVSKH